MPSPRSLDRHQMSPPYLPPPENPPEPAGAWVGVTESLFAGFHRSLRPGGLPSPHLTTAGSDVSPLPGRNRAEVPRHSAPTLSKLELTDVFHVLHHPWSGQHHSGWSLKWLPNPPSMNQAAAMTCQLTQVQLHSPFSTSALGVVPAGSGSHLTCQDLFSNPPLRSDGRLKPRVFNVYN